MDLPQIQQDTAAAGSRALNPIHHTFNRIFSKPVFYATVLAFGLICLSGNLRKPEELLSDPDIWWHLANARTLTATHQFVQIEPYSFTVSGERWINPEWLSELPFWFGYQSLGLAGIYLVTAIGLCANILFIYGRSCWQARHADAAFWACALAVPLMTVNAGPRTILFAYLALSAEMGILEASERGKTRLLWLLPPLFCVWINLHGSWAAGAGLLTLYLLCGSFSFHQGVIQQQALSGSDRRRFLLVWLASLAALFINPYGWRLIWYPFDMLLNQKLVIAHASEWQPLNSGSALGRFSVAAILLMIVANCWRGRSWKIHELAFLFFAWFMAFSHMRFTFMAAALTTPLLACDLARGFFSKPKNETIPAMNALFAAGAVCAVLYFFPANSTLQHALEARYPLRSIAFIQPSWRTFNQDTLGGIMDLNGKPTYLDTRLDTFDHHGEFADYLGVLYSRQPFDNLNKYRIDHLLIPANWPLAYLLEHTPGWQVEMREGSGANAYELFASSQAVTGESIRCAATSSPDQHSSH
jgi:hypothetical protein